MLERMEIYDHIVVGAGSAGCAVAARLSEDPVRRVLLIEAGGSDRTLATRAPAAFANLIGTKRDWDYETEPEPGLAGRRIAEPRGKLLGGCSAMNAMLWVRGSDLDYDGWDLPGWSWDDVLPVFERIESGPMRITPLRDLDPVARAFVASAQASGIAGVATPELSGPALAGVAPAPTTTSGGRRWSTARAYLDAARRRPNLTVITKALVHRVVVRDGRAVGVEVEQRGRVRRIGATRDIVLSAGAFNTPHLLQLSGIGDPDHLRDIGVEVVADNPAVGAHLQEHPFTFCNWELREPWIGLADAAKPQHLVRWLLTGRGKIASNVAEAIAHVRTMPDLPAPDMQLVHAPAYFWENGQAEHPRPAFAIAQSYWTPRSRGHVRAVSRDPRALPSVQLNLLADREDLAAMVRGVQLTRELVEQAPLRDMITAEIHPGPTVRTAEEIERWVRETCLNTYHPACTARMGEPGEGAIDEQLRVHGVTGLRVADASALPVITRANTNAPAILFGERCADFIRADDARSATSRTRRAAVAA